MPLDNNSSNPKALTGEQMLVRQIERLQSLSDEESAKFLGQDWFSECKRIYNLDEIKNPAPSFRPKVVIPQLQVLALNEVTDLTDADPKIYLCKADGSRDAEHEKALMAQWRGGFWNNKILIAELWAQLSGIGYVQWGYDPSANRGRGEVWVNHRSPDTVHQDPSATNEDDWAYLIFEDRLYVEDVQRRWPERGYSVQGRAATKSTPESGYGFTLPDGPMSVVGGLPAEKMGPSDGRVRVRWLYAFDPTVEELQAPKEVRTELLAMPRYRPRYPNGRLVIECEGTILFDGDNPFPNKLFPLVKFLGLPALSGWYPPPPARFTKPLQDLAGRMYTQLFENVVRLNNGVTYIHENTGIDAQQFGGLPGEVHVINAQSQPPQTVWPAPVPQHMVQLPQLLLDKQKELQGFTPQRMGEPGAGNISPELYQASIWQSKPLTRLRGRLMAESIQRLAKGTFYTMAKFYKNKPEFPAFPDSPTSEFALTSWLDISNSIDDYNVYLDPGSIRPLSASAMRMMVPMLKEMAMIDNQTALEMLDIPNAAEIATKLDNQAKLAALSQVRNRK